MSLETWNKVFRPPVDALKTIKAGRLKGFSDVNPQWRYKVMTEQFGICGVGWKYEITRVWLEPASAEQVFAFATVNVYIKSDGQWSDPIPGIGGSTLTTKESSGLHSSDECFKMAVTDALSVALKMIGVAADIYMGRWDGSKYAGGEPEQKNESPISQAQVTILANAVADKGYDPDEKLRALAEKIYRIPSIADLPESKFNEALKRIMTLSPAKGEQ